MIRLNEDVISCEVMSENDDLGSNGMMDDKYIDDRIEFYNNCYKLLNGLKRYNNAYHDLGIVNCEYPYYFNYMPKTRVNENKYGVLYTVNLFGTEYKLVYVQNESDCFILESISIAQDFADDFEKFTEKCDTYCNHKNLDVFLLDIEILDADVYPYGISPNMKTIFVCNNIKAYLFEENGIKFIYELDTDSKKGFIYLHCNDKDDFMKWCKYNRNKYPLF